MVDSGVDFVWEHWVIVGFVVLFLYIQMRHYRHIFCTLSGFMMYFFHLIVLFLSEYVPYCAFLCVFILMKVSYIYLYVCVCGQHTQESL